MRWGALLIALLLTACGNSGGGHFTAASSGPTGVESIYLQTVRDYLPPGYSDTQLLAFGHGICREFNDGITWTGIITGLVNGGMDARKAGGAVAVAVVALCPEHESDLPNS